MIRAKQSWGLHWFRRDLRVTGNRALLENGRRHSGRVVGVFCIDPQLLSRPDISADRFAFLLKTLVALRGELREAGGDLRVLEHGPRVAFERLFAELQSKARSLPEEVSWNRDYEPFARERDARAEYLFETSGVRTHVERDHLLIEPGELQKPAGRGFYSVYTPFARRWFEALSTPEVQARLADSGRGGGHRREPLFRLTWSKLLGKGSVSPNVQDVLDETVQKYSGLARVPLPDAGHAAAVRLLRAFKPKLDSYGEDRERPALEGTSRLSIYLKNGSITVSQVIAGLKLGGMKLKVDSGAAQFVRELVWREFYYQILWHRPDVERQAFNPALRELAWENDEALFSAWKEGRTGFPIVDAGMRQLIQTGWMHNRVRMIVASFLTKDLLIDWRWGERFFMEHLLDGDLAANNGGWQWAASTGCDPQPYFRIFNPERQSRSFDPQGDYIRRYVPELAGVGDREIHAPGSRIKGYPAPVVEHPKQRTRALALYRRSR